MQFVTVIKPQVLKGPTKAAVLALARARSGTVTFSNSAQAAYADKVEVIGLNLEKHRKKVKRLHRDADHTQHTKILEKAHWVCYKYAFKIDWLEANNLRVQQGTRTFKLVRNRK